MSLFDDMRKRRAFAYVWYGRAAGRDDEVAADRIGIRPSMFTFDEADKSEEELTECKPGSVH